MTRWPGRRKAALRTSTQEAGWAAAEVGGWRDRGLRTASVAADIDRAVEANETTFRLDVDGPKVTLGQRRELLPALAALHGRATLYERFLQEIVRLYRLEIKAPLLLDVNDLPLSAPGVPLFSFQKKIDGSELLLPDVELLDHNFYVDEAFRDTRAFADKQNAAIFVGSTTGGGCIDAQMVRDRGAPRLAAAEHFRDSPRIVFELPHVVQTQDDEVTQMVRALGLGSRRYTWAEQFGHQVLLSMDGNGATCSRVAISLMSNSVLAKFTSSQVLYYFRGLEPSRSYVSIDGYADVDRLMDDLLERTDDYARMVVDQQAFVRAHLCRPAVYEYTAELLLRYAHLLEGGTDFNDVSLSEPRFLIDAAVSSRPGRRRLGGVNAWAGTPRSRTALNGLAIFVSPRIPAEAVSCRVLDCDGREHAFAGAGADCALPDGADLFGLAVELAPPAGDAYILGYEALFVDGHASGPLTSGQMARSPAGGALEAFSLTVSPR